MSKQIGHYEIVGELGRGGMGVVYKAFEQSLGRHVAIKMLGDQVINDENIRARFVREARSAAALNHPNIIQIYFVGEDAGRPFFAMEYVEGRSLAQVIREERQLQPARAAQILLEAASGLALAHDHGIVHRDIKPANIMITKQGLVKLTDFGIAHVNEGGEKLTATGHLLGTPGYLSPEVCLGKPIEARSDIFSLGIVYYEMLIGQTPFRADSPLAMLREVVEVEVPDPRILNKNVDLDTHIILAKMVAKDPNNRYFNCQELVEDLKGYLGGKGLTYASLNSPVVQDLATVAGVAFADAPTVHLDNTLSDQTLLVPPPTAPGMPLPPDPTAPTVAAKGSAFPPPPPPSAVPHEAPTVHAQGSAFPPPPPAPVHPVNQSGFNQPPAPPRPPAKKTSLLPLVAVFSVLAIAALGGGLWFASSFKNSAAPDPVPNVVENAEPAPLENPSEAPTSLEETSAASESELANEPAPETTGTEGVPEAAAAAATAIDQVQTEKKVSDPKVGKTAFAGERVATASAEPETEPASAYESVTEAEPVQQADAGSAALTAKARKPAPAVERNEPTFRVDRNASLPATPVLGVVVHGDRAITGPLFQHLNQFLADEGYSVIDSDVLGISHDAPLPTLDVLGQQVAAKGGDVLVLAQIEILDQRELNYMGRSSAAYQAELVIKHWFPAGGRKVGQDTRITLEYTALNAERKGEEAARSALDGVLAAIRPDP